MSQRTNFRKSSGGTNSQKTTVRTVGVWQRSLTMVLKTWEIHGKPWEKHGENSMDSFENNGASGKIPWLLWGNYHAFHAGMEKENCQKIPHESIESMESKTMENHGKHGNLQK